MLRVVVVVVGASFSTPLRVTRLLLWLRAVYKWLLHLLKPFKIYLFLQLVIDYFKWRRVAVVSRGVRKGGRKLREEK